MLLKNLTVKLAPSDHAVLGQLARRANVSKTEWIRGAIRAAADSHGTEMLVRRNVRADAPRHGGVRSGAGRPRATTKATDEGSDEHGA